MKKVVLILAAASLMASAAMASSVVDSKHNLAVGSVGTFNSNNYDEVCVFCHTPHMANTSVTLAPLWNRSAADLSSANVYTSATIEATTIAVTAADINQTDAPLCLSCHDGTALADPLVNPSNLAGNAQPGGLGTLNGTAADLGTDFRNDHPIGFVYNDVWQDEVDSGANGLFEDPATAGGVQFFAGEMWCSSCHDVHDDADYPFLVLSNAASGLCITCHNK